MEPGEHSVQPFGELRQRQRQRRQRAATLMLTLTTLTRIAGGY